MRKSMKKLIALTLACLMLATLFVGCGKKDDGGSSGGDTIKLGWMGSLTGDQAAYGTCESQTLKMLVEDLNANGGLLGKQVELICYDTKATRRRRSTSPSVCARRIRSARSSARTPRVSASPSSPSSTSTRSPICPPWRPTRRSPCRTVSSRNTTSASASSIPSRARSPVRSCMITSALTRPPSSTTSTTTTRWV